MRLINVLLARIRGLFRREAILNDIEEELRTHIELDSQSNIEHGMTEDDARIKTLRTVGNLTRLRELSYEVRGGGLLETFWQDLRYGARMLFKNPGFTLVAVVTLGLGIGANTAIFSVVNGVLLRPLNYKNPEQIVVLLERGRGPVSPANFMDIRAACRSYSNMSAAEAWGGTLTWGDKTEALSGLRMGDDLFESLGVQPLLGRTLEDVDFRPGGDHVVVLSHKLWRRVFGGDESIVGRQLILSSEAYTVVGVMPPDFFFPPFWSTRAELWAPLDLRNRAADRGGSSLRIFARLNPGVGLQAAQAELDTLNAQLASSYPEDNTGIDIRVGALNEKVVGNVRPALLVLMGAVGFVLLIACANVACLLLSRAAARQKETAVRIALGASRWRILRQLLTESMMLSVFGAVIGVFLAFWGVDVLTGLMAGNTNNFSVRLPRLNEIRLDGKVLLFTLLISLLSSVVFGLAPGLAASKPDLDHVLKETGRGISGGRRRLREFLVVAELALALVMLVGAGLLMNSFLRLQAVDPGFNPHNVLTFTTSIAGLPQYAGPSREVLYQQLTDRLLAIPGVKSVSAINHLPLAGDRWGQPLTIQGRPLPPPGQGVVAVFKVSRPGYFETMGIQRLAGRDFNELDKAGAPGAIIINETLARRQWPDENPIGARVTLDDPQDAQHPPQWYTIVGVVKDVKQSSWMDAPDEEIYLPFQQSRGFFSSMAQQYASMTVVLRSSLDPAGISSSAKEVVRNLDPKLPVSDLVSMEEVIADSLWQPRFNLRLIGLFAAASLLLAAVGLYGVMSFSVAQRTHEVGLRLALGASHRDVLSTIVGQGMKLAAIGVVMGLLASVLLTRLMTTMLFEVSATDFRTLGAISAVLLFVAFFACFLPARRATKVDPLVALRYE